MLRITNLVLARGAKRLLDGANLTVHAGHKVGLIGPNGSGKSSLFALILGELHQDAGSLDLPPAWTIAHVAQETIAVSTPAIEFVLDGDRELREVERALVATEGAAATDPERQGEALAHLHHRFDEIGGYVARARAATLLSGLGFPAARHNDPVARFSGGWRMRLNLAQALMCRSDLLLLDEPTNHLDLDAVLWLEDWLARYPGTLLLITHDRDFLDGVVTTIAHVDQLKIKTYTGNYSQFEQERAMQLALQQATYAKQQRQIAHLQAFVDRFRAKATKAKQAQSRIKALERMERIAAAHVDSPFEFAFAPVPSAAQQLLRLEHVTLGYVDAPADPRRPRLGNPQWRPDRPARPQRRRQVDAAQGHRRNADAARGRAAHRADTGDRLLRAAPGRAVARRREPALAPGEGGPDGARAGPARLPGRVRFPRRHGHRIPSGGSPAAKRPG